MTGEDAFSGLATDAQWLPEACQLTFLDDRPSFDQESSEISLLP